MSNLETKIDKIGEDITDIKVTLAVNTQSLQEHMKRSDMLEEYVNREIEPLKADLQNRKVEKESKKALVSKIYTLSKILAALATVITALHVFHIL